MSRQAIKLLIKANEKRAGAVRLGVLLFYRAKNKVDKCPSYIYLSLTEWCTFKLQSHKPRGIKQMSDNSQYNPLKRNENIIFLALLAGCQAVVSLALIDCCGKMW